MTKDEPKQPSAVILASTFTPAAGFRTSTATLSPGGWLLLEHGFRQGPDVRNRLRQAGLSEVATLVDLQGLDRISLGRRPPADTPAFDADRGAA
jgi:hypothetical protein